MTIFVLTLFVSGCSKESPINKGTVTYTVNCSPAGFIVIYQDVTTRATIQQTVSVNSWTLSFTGQDGDLVALSAFSPNQGSTVSVIINYKGNVFGSSHGTGDFASATTQGVLR